MRQPLDIPYLTCEHLIAQAGAFLDETHKSRSIPIPIELIVESLGLNIVPVPGLQDAFDMEGCTSGDMTCIFVDKWVAETRESRFRFTLAHEIAHVRLHAQVFEGLLAEASTPSEWNKLIRGIPDIQYGRMEWQANMFAGLVLVPSDSLKEEYNRVVGGIRKMMKNPLLKGVPGDEVTGVAWDRLANELASPFSVSEEVIRKRLEFDGFRPQGL